MFSTSLIKPVEIDTVNFKSLNLTDQVIEMNK